MFAKPRDRACRQQYPFEEMSQQWLVCDSTAFDLTGPRFEPSAVRSKDESVNA